MKIAISQLNYHIGNFEANKEKIIYSIRKAKEQKAELLVFSELAICGYPPLDLLERKDFTERAIESVNEIAEYCEDIAVIVGAPRINTAKGGKKLYNSAYFIENSKIKSITDKSLLPNYDIFDEYRYFEPNKQFNIIEFNGKKIALTICEDLWERHPSDNKFEKEDMYTISPMEELSKQNPDLIINIAASPFSYTQMNNREQVLTECCTKYRLPLIYINQTGGNTELLFDGSSMVINSKGDITERLNSFEEDFKVIDTENIESSLPAEKEEDNYIRDIHDALVTGIRDYFHKNGLKKATLGLSGGIDSAVVVCLAERALGAENIRVLLLPSQYSSGHSVKDAEDLAHNLNIQYDIVPIKGIFDACSDTMKDVFAGCKFDVTEENMQARIRGTLLMALSNKFGHILLNTSNKSEAAVGYGTLYGDMNGAISVLGDVYKTDVFRLARYINKDEEVIPENTITKAPSAELRPDQKDEDSLPPYEILDAILKYFIEHNLSKEDIIAKGYDAEIVNRAIHLLKISEHKRFQTAPILRVSSKAFGFGRRIPLVAKY